MIGDPSRSTRKALGAGLERALALEGAFAFLRRPGAWFVLALALGAGLRAFLVLATEGTYDVLIWQSHAGWTREWGLIGYYEKMEVFNQPPFIAWVMSWVWVLAEIADLPFRVLLRAPMALLDLATALLLVRAFRGSPLRWVVGAAYWLHPLALIFSAYHGNTDSAVAFAMLLAVVLAGEGRGLAAAAVLGAGLWIKLPVALALPALLFAVPGWRNRFLFGAVFGAVGVATYLPALALAPGLLLERVFLYSGSSIRNPAGIPIWGVWSLLSEAGSGSFFGRLAAFHEAHNSAICWAGVLAYAWLRRAATGTRALGVTVCGSLSIFYALTSKLAFQYFAWAIPFWFFPGLLYLLATTLAAGSYVYAVYAFVTGGPFLLGRWNFQGRASWPALLVGLRNASLVVFAASAPIFVVSALRSPGRRSSREPAR